MEEIKLYKCGNIILFLQHTWCKRLAHYQASLEHKDMLIHEATIQVHSVHQLKITNSRYPNSKCCHRKLHVKNFMSSLLLLRLFSDWGNPKYCHINREKHSLACHEPSWPHPCVRCLLKVLQEHLDRSFKVDLQVADSSRCIGDVALLRVSPR